MKKTKKCNVLIVAFMASFMILSASVCAAGNNNDNGWWNVAGGWWNNGSTNVGLSNSVLSELSSLVEVAGTAVIAIATVVIGIKYMLGTVQSKTEAKESLVTLLVACIFFFGWTSIRSILIVGDAAAENGLSGSNTYLSIFNGGNYTNAFASVFNIVVFIGKVITVIAILFMGVRYIFAGAEAKAKLKEQSPALLIGIILIFCTTTFLGVVANAINEIL